MQSFPNGKVTLDKDTEKKEKTETAEAYTQSAIQFIFFLKQPGTRGQRH